MLVKRNFRLTDEVKALRDGGPAICAVNHRADFVSMSSSCSIT
jgi:hypothetical protein